MQDGQICGTESLYVLGGKIVDSFSISPLVTMTDNYKRAVSAG